LALQAARLLPDIPFTLVLNGGDARIEAEIRHECPSHVTLVRTIPRAEMRAAFLSSRLFLSTGSPLLEGFPNVLLEAAGTGTPIVSCEDFDQFLATSGAGLVTGDSPAAIAAAIQILWNNAATWEQCSLQGRHHTAQHHGIEPIVTSVLKLCPPVPG
jgi:glycosyltransferase involved in cell wall biosynthesis